MNLSIFQNPCEFFEFFFTFVKFLKKISKVNVTLRILDVSVARFHIILRIFDSPRRIDSCKYMQIFAKFSGSF